MNLARRALCAAFAVVFVLAACGPLRGIAQHGSLPMGTLTMHGTTIVPFVLSGNHAYVKAAIAGKSYAFIFDSGGTATITPAIQRVAQFDVMGQAHVIGAGEAALDADIVRVPELRIGNATYSGGAFLVLDMPLPSTLNGLPFGGIIGREFLASSVVTIDYANSTLALTPPSMFHADAGAIALSLSQHAGHPSVRASVDGHEGDFDVDTGSQAAITLTESFAKSSGLESELTPQIDAVIGSGVGGIILGKAARATSLQLGTQTLASPIVTISHTKSGALADPTHAGGLGGEVLRRFTVTFDVPNATLYLTPNAAVSQPFAFNRGGLYTQRAAAGESVLLVDAGGPADSAGIRVGDLIVAIDGRKVSVLAHDHVSDIWREHSGTVVNLKVMRGGKVLAKTVVLRDLV